MALGSLDLRLLLVADAATCLVATVLVGVLVGPAARRPGAAPRPGGAGWATPWRDRRLLAMLAAGSGFALVYMAFVVGLPLTLDARGLAPERAGVLLTVSAVTVVAGQPMLRWRVLSEPFRALVVGHLLLAVGLLVTAVATTLTGFVGASVVWSLGDVLLLSQLWSVVSRLAPDDARASYLAVFGLSWGVATTLAPLLTTQLLEHAGPTVLWSTLAGVALVLAALQPVLARLTGVDGSHRRTQP